MISINANSAFDETIQSSKSWGIRVIQGMAYIYTTSAIKHKYCVKIQLVYSLLLNMTNLQVDKQCKHYLTI